LSRPPESEWLDEPAWIVLDLVLVLGSCPEKTEHEDEDEDDG
jgi:hypothetical protein